MFRKIIVGAGGFLLNATPLVTAATTPSSPKPEETKTAAGNQLCRPSELPIYPTPTSTVAKLELDEPSELEKTLMEPVKIVRTSLVSAVHQVKSVSDQVGTAVNDTTDQFSFIISYLREEDNEAQRVGATAMGTLTGFIFGLRGGLIKKITYSLMGTGAMGSICYPEEATQYFNESVVQGKLLANVAYNFVMGVKPGDPETPTFLPNFKIPTSLDEISALIRSTKKKPAQEEQKSETK